jgi:NAD(P)-dependent dehydrogenase (short-subunit alcohol dehydrogenase family)
MTARLSNVVMLAGSLLVATRLVVRGLRTRRAIPLHGTVALITGGSRGLGLLIARELGRHGAHVVLVARDAEELERARTDLAANGSAASVIVADVGSGADADRIVEDVVRRHGRIDVLVNNAGVIQAGPVDHMSLADFDEAIAVHFWAPLRTMRAAIPHMRRQGGGRIVNVSSIGGKVAVPHLVPYCASKFALTGLSTSMRAELLRDNIAITTVSPGLMRTGSPFNARFKGRHRQEFAWFAIADSMPWLSINAERAAQQIVDAARHGDAELIVSLPARLVVMAYGVAPNLIAQAMGLTNALLPTATGDDGDRARTGWQSGSSWAPSLLTRLTERAAARNNELPASQ